MINYKHFCLAALATALPVTAMADFSSYLGVGMGGSRVERNDVNLTFSEYTTGTILADPPFNVQNPPIERLNLTDPSASSFSFKVFGGVRYGRYLGVELGYVNLGRADDGSSFEIPAITASAIPLLVRPLQDRQIDVETKIDGFQGYAVGFLPLGEQIELFAKVGLIRWDADVRVIDRIGAVFPVDQPGIPEILASGELVNRVLEDDTPDGVSFSSESASETGTDIAAGAGIQIKASERVSLRAELEWFDIDGTSLTWTGNVGLVFGF